MLDDVSAPPAVAVEVVEYILADDPSFYQNHLFALNVWMEQNTYRINRSYASFVELDYRLRYQYPRSNLPALPLSGCKPTVKKAPARRLSTTTTVEPTTTLEVTGASDKASKRKALKRVDPSEAIAQKKTPLNVYMKDLFRVPEILMSEMLQVFLDEESGDGLDMDEFDENLLENMEIPLLLQDEKVVTKTVYKYFPLSLEVKFNTVLVWSFTTTHHNIGFSATYNDIEVQAYQRYNSHEQVVRGFMEIPNSGTANLIWDNTFSKWRSKTLNYSAKAVDLAQYEKAKLKAAEIRGKKIAFHKQRIVLKRLLSKLSNDLLMSTNPSKTASLLRSTITDLADELGEVDSTSLKYISGDEVDVKGLFRQIEQLTNEKKFLQQALSESETALVSERTACAESMRGFESLLQSKEALEEELFEVRNELDSIKSEYHDFVAATQRDQLGRFYSIDALLALSTENAAMKGVAIANFSHLLEGARLLTQRLGEAQQISATAEQAIAKLKADRKQLKAFGIQSKERIDILEKEVAHVEHDRDMVSRDNAGLRARIETLEKTIAQYRNAAAVADMAMYGTLRSGHGDDTASIPSPHTELAGAGYTNNDGAADGQTSPINAAVSRARTLSAMAMTQEEEDAMLHAEEDGGGDKSEDEDEAARPPKIIVHDFAAVEPDEVSQALEAMAESLQGMLPTWDQIMGTSTPNKPQQQSFFSFGF